MRDSIVYYPVRDFRTLRICCHHQDCRCVLEVPLEKVEEAMRRHNTSCPVCGKPFTNQAANGGGDVIGSLARAIIALDKLGQQVGVEFPGTGSE